MPQVSSVAPAAHYEEASTARAGWIAKAVVYGVAPRNYDPPTFAGVAARLDGLADLGITALWFSPLNQTPSGDYGYAVTDYFELRPEYGTKADFKALIESAHARGIRVLMDFVPNHTSDQHPFFQDALEFGESSRYWDFYDRDAAGNPTHYFSWTHLPNLNYANPEVQRHMLEAFTYWVREFDVDGFRIDAIWGIKERNPSWLDQFRVEMNRIKPDMLLFAEASARDAFYAEHGFDAAYDWTNQLGHWAWENVFSGATPIGDAMVDVLTDSGRGYHPDALALRFLNNNDTGARFITTYGPDRYRVALAMLLTLPGLPCLFTGDEFGAEFHPYESSGPIDWSDRHDLRPDVKKLIHLRQRYPALHSLDWQPISASPATPLFAYLRTAENGQAVVVVLNFSEVALKVSVKAPLHGAKAFGAGPVTDLWSGDAFPGLEEGQWKFSVPGWGFRLMTQSAQHG